MKRTSPLLGGRLAALLVCVVACRAGESAPKSPAPAPVAASAPVAVAPPPPPGRAPPLLERLQREAGTRPSGAVRLEDLVAALEARGVTIARTRQVLGETMGARYCAIAQTARGNALAACEYDSAGAADTGRDRAVRRFQTLVPGRRTLTNGKTLLTIAPRDGKDDDESETIQAAFAALDPR